MVLNEDIHEFDDLEASEFKRILKAIGTKLRKKHINILGMRKKRLKRRKKRK